MKAVLISIQPKWCELIASGKKTVEVRKTKPKLDVPFKCYIYCTKPRHYYKISKQLLISDESLFLVNGKVRMCDGFGVEYEDSEYKHLNCKVIGEFVCNEIECFTTDYRADKAQTDRISKQSCVGWYGLSEYEYNSPCLYAWHISDLKIYDKPKELGEFVVEGDCLNGDCKKCKWFDGGNGYNVEADCLLPYAFHFKKTVKPLFRPPQSWCYVESEVTEE